jgi:hypothetical protein
MDIAAMQVYDTAEWFTWDSTGNGMIWVCTQLIVLLSTLYSWWWWWWWWAQGRRCYSQQCQSNMRQTMCHQQSPGFSPIFNHWPARHCYFRPLRSIEIVVVGTYTRTWPRTAFPRPAVVRIAATLGPRFVLALAFLPELYGIHKPSPYK